MGAFSGGFLTDVVTLCVENFDKQQTVSTLADLEAVNQEGINLDDRRCQSLTLFHEAFHLMNGKENTDDNGCQYPTQCHTVS